MVENDYTQQAPIKGAPPPEPPDISRYAGPYERWVFSPRLGRAFSFPAISEGTSGFFTALLEAAPGRPLPDLSDNPTLRSRVPPLWQPPGESLTHLPFTFYDANQNQPRRLQDEARQISRLLGSITGRERSTANFRYRVNFPVPPETWVAEYAPTDAPADMTAPARPPRAIVGVIDDGIPFANRAYLDAMGKTRIASVWLQTGTARDRDAVPFGREIANTEIDALRACFGREESALYRASGAIDADVPELGTPLWRASTHGAHIMGLAAGADDPGEMEDVAIIAVQLPNTIAWDTSGFGKDMYMLSAVHYILNRAKALAAACGVAELPLALNFSYGWSAGRHDGQSELELAMEQLISARKALAPTALVMPSGNTFSDAMYAQFDDADFDAGPAEFGWQIQPDDRTSSYLEIWFPDCVEAHDYTVTVTLPTGEALRIEVSAEDDTGPGDPRRFAELEARGGVIVQLSADKHRNNRWRAMLAVAPTCPVRGEIRRAPAGLWHIRIERSGDAHGFAPDCAVGIWVQRDDDPPELGTSGRQSYLVALGASDGLSKVRGQGSLSAICTAASTTVVAGLDANTGRAAYYSSAGQVLETPTLTVPMGQQVDISATANRSRAVPGSLSRGVLSGARSVLVGTSAAAPQVTRALAQGQWGLLDPMPVPPPAGDLEALRVGKRLD